MAIQYPSIRPNGRPGTYLASDGNTGALISISTDDDGALLIEVYRADANVLVRAPFENLDVPR